MTAAQSLRFDDVTVCYGPTPAVHHLSAELPCGELVALMGPNGAGKSTLLRAVLGWHRLTTGSITLAGSPCHRERRRIGYLPQRTAVDWDFPVTVRDVVAMGRYQSSGAFAGLGADDERVIDAAITEMGMEWLQHRQIAELSGGQQQRTFLARAVASGADVFLLDEPFAGLDPTSTADLVRRLQAWARQGRLVVTVVHDLDLARRFFPRALLVRSHLIAAGATPDVLSERNLIAAYGQSWLAGRSLISRGPEPTVPDVGAALRDARVRLQPAAKPGGG